MSKPFRLDNWSIKNAIRKQEILKGKKPIGRGYFSAIYEGTRKNTVIKVTVDETAWAMLNDWCVGISHKNLPRVIKNYGQIGEARIAGNSYSIYMYEVEKLQPLKGENRELAKKIEDLTRSLQTKYHLHTHDSAYLAFNDAAHCKELSRGLRNVMAKISDFCSNYSKTIIDLHRGNMMQRANGDLVIIDPICDNEMLKAIYKQRNRFAW